MERRFLKASLFSVLLGAACTLFFAVMAVVEPKYKAKALASGAEAVILGRAVNYGLAAGGAAGVTRALDILRDEFDRTLALNCCRS